MRSHWVLLPLLSALVGSAKSDLVKRQSDSTITLDDPDPTTSSDGGGSTEDSTTRESTTSSDDQDTTVTVTTTVSGEAETVSSRTTREITRTTTIVDTSTVFETTTVTSSDEDTSTETVFVTSTVFRNQKRGLAIYTLPIEPAEAVAITTAAPTATDLDSYNAEMLKRRPDPGANIFKRDTVTETETVTEGGDGATTVIETVTRTVVSARTSRTTTTELETKTEQASATTTTTVTSTRTVTSQTGTTGVITETGGPTETSGSGDGNDNNGGGGGSDLSTGAKAGIGAGAGVAGLALIAGLAWFCFKRRRGGSKPEHDDMFGSSEVPVGAAAAAGAAGRQPMSHQPSTTASYAPTRTATLPNVAPEGYRGTAMGDGRAGYAKPEPYGAAYTRASAQPPSSVSPVSAGDHAGYSHPNTNRNSTLVGSSQGGDQLPEHSSPSDMNNAAYMGRATSTSPGPYAAELGHDGHGARWQSPGAAEMDTIPAGHHQNGQVPSNVYEMPGQEQR